MTTTKIIPPTIANLANSKKAVTFWVILGLWIAKDQTGLTFEAMVWVTIAFSAYVLAQGIADFGKHNGAAAKK